MNKEERDKRMENKLEEKDGEKCTSELMIVYIYILELSFLSSSFLLSLCAIFNTQTKKKNKTKTN